MQFDVRHGCFSYPDGKQVLNDIQFDFDCRGIMSILGANGAGKTTLLKCMLGLQKWTSGGTYIDNQNIARLPSKTLWSRIGYVPQAKMPSFVYTVAELVVLGRSAHLGDFARPGPEDWHLVNEALNTIGIGHLANKLCNQISGGEYQLALVARALVGRPELLVLDEPESNLDFKNQLLVLQVLEKLSREHSIGAIINTHFPAHALEISDRSLVMFPDKQTLYGPSSEVLTPETLTRSFGVNVKIVDINVKERPQYACVVAVN